MNSKELEERTKIFATDVIHFVAKFPKTKALDVISYQLLKSATSIGANYREATRAESKIDFIHKLGIVEKETNETLYWLELLQETLNKSDDVNLKKLLNECHELLAIFTASRKTAKRKM